MNDDRQEILIVDDDPLNIRFLEVALEKDYRVRTARDGPEALRQVSDCTPDLILLDVIMPGMSGFQVARAIRSDENCCTVSIIFLTILDSSAGESEGLESGGIDYLTKPFNLRFLLLRVRNHLELKRRNNVIREQ